MIDVLHSGQVAFSDPRCIVAAYIKTLEFKVEKMQGEEENMEKALADSPQHLS